MMDDDVKLLPCPFCGGVLEHIESETIALNPPRIYHEYHHGDGDCLLSKKAWYFSDDPERRARWIAAWNTRAPAPLVWSSERPTVTGWYRVRFKDPSSRSLRSPWVIEIDQRRLDETKDLPEDSNLEFAGPIEEPQEPNA